MLATAALLTDLAFAARDIDVATPADLEAAINSARPGDNIRMANRVWQDLAIVVPSTINGAAGNPITIGALSQGQAILSGNSTVQIQGSYIVLDGLRFQNGYTAGGWGGVPGIINAILIKNPATDVRVTNCAILGYSHPQAQRCSDADMAKPDADRPNYCQYRPWIRAEGSRHRIDHNYFANKTNLGMMIELRADHTEIDYNYFADTPLIHKNAVEAIQVGLSSMSGNVHNCGSYYANIHHNLFHRYDGDGGGEGISVKSSHNAIHHNTVDSSRNDIYLRDCNDNTVTHNFVFARGVSNSGGIGVFGENHVIANNYISGTRIVGDFRGAVAILGGSQDGSTWPARNVTVAFNTLVDNAEPFTFGLSGKTYPPENITVANNVAVGTIAPLIRYRQTPSNASWSNNVFFGADLGIAQPSGIAVADPSLVSDSQGIYRPAPGSLLIDNAGTQTFGVTDDIDGQTRPAGALMDIGADELSTEPVVNSPVTPAQVGPPSLVGAFLLYRPGDKLGDVGVTGTAFDWNDLAGAASYALLVDDNSDFSSPEIAASGLTASQYTSTVQLGYLRQYWWKVVATTGAGTVTSSTYSFITAAGVPQPFVLNNPANASLGMGPKGLIFDWNDSQLATSYTLVVDDNSDFSSPFINASALTASDYAAPAPLATNTTYWWKVTAINSFGEAAAGPHTFTTARSLLTTKEWLFNTGKEGWTTYGQVDANTFVWATGGFIDGRATGTDPAIQSPDLLGAPLSGYNIVKIRYKNGSAQTSARFFYTTNAATGFSGGKSKVFTVIPHDPGYTEYVVDMSTVSATWNGVLRRVRFDPQEPAVSGNTFSLDSVIVCTNDASSLVTAVSSGLAYSRVTQTWVGTIRITNSSAETISGPVQVVLSGLPAGVMLTNATGTYGASPYITAQAADLAPSATATVNVSFRNPNLTPITYMAKTYTGKF